MSLSLRPFRRLTVLVSVAVLLACCLAASPSYAGKGGKGLRFSSPAQCIYQGATLTGISPPIVEVKMKKGWARSYKFQYVRFSSQVIADNGAGWVKVPGAKGKVTKKISRKNVKRFAALAIPAVPTRPGYVSYRLKVRVQWFSPRTGRVERTVNRTVASYGVAGAGVCAASR